MSTAAVSTTVGAQLGRFVAELCAEDLPAEVAQKLRCNLLHDLACAMGAHAAGHELWAAIAAGRPPEATLLCHGRRVDIEHAAFANAAVMHTRAQDDTHFAAKTHVGSAVIPAVLALAERDGLSGRAVGTAIVAGCEVAAAVGERLAGGCTARGFRATPVFGTLGAAAACASLLGLDAEAAADAIAISSSFSGGLNQTWIDGTSEYRLELGMAARNGIAAAELAAAGFHGASHWYEGAAGFARAFAGQEDAASGDWELGSRWRLFEVTYKPYPVCAITQSPVQLAIDLANEHDLDPTNVSSVGCYLNPGDRSYPGTVNSGPFGDVGASLMSAQYCVSMALKHRGATLGALREFDDPVIAHLVSVTEVLGDETIPNLGARLEVSTSDGSAYRAQLFPDASTYGWDWDGVVRNLAAMEPEIAVDRRGLDRLQDAVSGLFELDTVEPLVRGTVA